MKIEQSNNMDQVVKNAGNTGNNGIAAYFAEQTRETGIAGQAGIFSRSQEAAKVSSAGNIQVENPTYGRPEDETKTVSEQLEQQMGKDSLNHKNEMVVLSNTLSADDYRELQKEGFSLNDTDSHTIITVTDKIKAVLAKAGVDISAYGDELDMDELEQITGSSAVARDIVQKLKAADLPSGEEQVKEVENAYTQASSVEGLQDETMDYLVRNQKEPTIENVYKAQYSGGASRMVSREDAATQYDDLEDQIGQVFRDAGIEPDTDSINLGKWMIANDLPLTKENITYLQQLSELSGKLADPAGEKDWILDSEIQAVEEGKSASQAYLIPGFSIMDQANEAKNVIDQANDDDIRFCQEHDLAITIANLRYAQGTRNTSDSENNTSDAQQKPQADSVIYTAKEATDAAFITARRQLEETRLMMTTQANYALLKKGISIDTAPLEELVSQLKEQENAYHAQLLGESQNVDVSGKAAQLTESSIMIERLKMQPAYVLTLENVKNPTIRSLDAAGSALQTALKNAGQSYEMLWTAPRKDMGDSIQKAFQNVDDILKDLGMDTSEANERAVRILAYNQTELTEEHIKTIRQADETVQRTFSSMSPAVTLEMIRRGINPLDMDLTELNETAEEIRSDLGYEDHERYSKYLWKMEKKNAITEEERTSYIGIYRLINQIDQTDGAVIGALIGQGADLSMRNLLSAVRTHHKNNIDYTVDDDFDGVSSSRTGMAIDGQIEMAYQKYCIKDIKESLSPIALSSETLKGWEDMTPDQMKEALQKALENPQEEQAEDAYAKEMLAEYEKTVEVPEQIYEILDQYDIPNTMTNVMAYQRMTMDQNQMFRTLFRSSGDQKEEKVEDLKEKVLENFAEAVENPQELADAQETLAEVAENVMKTMIIENDQVSTLDLKELRLMSTQFALCAKQAKEENYMIPMQTGDSITGVSLKIIRGTKDQGFVDIMFRGEMMGKVAASFQAKENGISGMIATDDPDTRELLADHMGMFAEALGEDSEEAVDVSVAYVKDLDLSNYRHTTETTETKSPVQTRRLYHIAESFLSTVKEFVSDRYEIAPR